MAKQLDDDNDFRHDDHHRDTQNDNVMTDDDTQNDIITSLNDSEVVTFRQIGEWLREKPNTVSARYFPKVVQAHEGLSAPPIQIDGKPTGYTAKAIAEYLSLGKDLQKYRALLEQRYPPRQQAVAPAQIEVYHPEQSVSGQLQDRIGLAEDTRLQAIARVSATIEAFKAQTQQLKQTDEREEYEQAFTEKYQELGESLRKKMIRQQAELDAVRLFKEQLTED